MAGPETGLTPNVDEIVNSGLASAGLGAGTGTSTVSAPGVPGPTNPMDPGMSQTGRGPRTTVDNPQWATPPSQADFGREDPYKDNFDTGLVVTARQGNPFPALANRQIGLNQRKAALEKSVQDFNLYGGIGKAHDRYQSAFNKWAPAQIDSKVNQLAVALGTDRSGAIKYLRTTDEGKAMFDRWGKETEGVGQENQAWTDSAIDKLAEVQAGTTYVPPDRLKLITDYAGSIGADGMPVSGEDVSDFLPKMRKMEGALREIQYIDKVVQPGLANAVQTLSGVDISKRRVGGKIMLTTEEKKGYDRALDYLAENSEDYVQQYHGGDKVAARAALESFFPTSVKETVVLEAPYNPSSGGSGSGAANGERIATTSVVSGPSGEAIKTLISPWQKTGGKPHKVAKGSFNTVHSGPVDLYAPSLTWNDDGHFFIEGTRLGSDEITKIKQNVEGVEEGDGESSENVIDYITTNKIGRPEKVAATNNGGEMETLWGSRDPFEVVAKQLQDRGWDVDAARVKKEWASPQSRERITQALK